MSRIINLTPTTTLGTEDQAIIRQGTIDKRISLSLGETLSWAKREGYAHLGEHVVGVVFSTAESFTTYQGRTYFVKKGVSLPYTSTVADASLDSNLQLGVSKNLSESQFMPYNQGRSYTTGEICYTKDLATDELSYWQWYSNVESLAGKSPLLPANRHTGWSDNTKPFYWVPYTGDQVGMPFYWLDTTAPEWSVMEINVDLPTAVYWRLARRYPNLVTGSTINTGEIRAEFLRVLDQGRGIDVARGINTAQRASMMSGNDDNDTANTSFQNVNSLREELGWETVDISHIPNSAGLLNWASGTVVSKDTNPVPTATLDRWIGASRSRNVARAMAIAI